MIDEKVCERLGLPVNPFNCDISYCAGVKGAGMSRSLIQVYRCVKVEVGILGLGCVIAYFWVTNCQYDKGILVVLGSYQTKKCMLRPE